MGKNAEKNIDCLTKVEYAENKFSENDFSKNGPVKWHRTKTSGRKTHFGKFAGKDRTLLWTDS